MLAGDNLFALLEAAPTAFHNLGRSMPSWQALLAGTLCAGSAFEGAWMTLKAGWADRRPPVQPHHHTELLSGVIEGFYGQPWSWAERLELFGWMSQWGLNTYVYAPKDDLKLRALWRELYSDVEAQALANMIRECSARQLRFVFALSPGLDIRYTEERELQTLIARFDQVLNLGCKNFAVLFDDIPDQVSPAVLSRWGSLASAQCHIANSLFSHASRRAPGGRFLFCPTPYCGRMARAGLGGPAYLETLGRELDGEIDVFWTGPEIISPEITVEHICGMQTVLRRKPVIWDNLHANDYDGRRFHCGPYSGRSPDLRTEVSGLLLNPNSEFPLNFVPLRTFAAYVRVEGAWEERAEYLKAVQEWLPRFATAGTPIPFEDLVLFADCFYLPHREGPGAEALLKDAEACLSTPQPPAPRHAAAFRRASSRLRRVCAAITELRDRPLFYALSRRIWDLREELDLLERFLDYWQTRDRRDPKDASAFTSDFHLPGTYRGGVVARLQRLLQQQLDGSFVPAAVPEPGPNLKPPSA